MSRFGLLGLCKVITLCSDLRLGWGLKQTCSFPWELSNGVLHSTYTHKGWVDSWLLVVGRQTSSLTFGPSFCHNLCCRCPNGPCKPIFDIYTLIVFQWYKEHPNARCFDPYNWTLKFREFQKTPKSQFWECEFHPHTPSKWGCDINYFGRPRLLCWQHIDLHPQPFYFHNFWYACTNTPIQGF